MKTLKTIFALTALTLTSLSANAFATEEITKKINFELQKSIEVMIEKNNKELQNELLKTLDNATLKIKIKETVPKNNNKEFLVAVVKTAE